MEKLKVGDRVQYIANCNYPLEGNTPPTKLDKTFEATIIKISASYLLEFDNYIKRHGGLDINIIGKWGHCWWFLKENMKYFKKI